MPATHADAHESIRWLVTAGRTHLAGEGLAQGLADWQRQLLEQQRELRKRSRHRFPEPSNWLWTDRSLAQASDFWTAAFKAAMFPPNVLVADGCSGAGVDLVALAARGPVLGIDADPDLALLASSNAAAHGYELDVHCGHLPGCWKGEAEWLHIDPDRRSEGHRTTDAEQFSPRLAEVLGMAHGVRGAIVKLAPSTRFTPDLEQQVEAESGRLWIGSQGECRQQLLLTGALGEATGSRTAVLCEPQKIGGQLSEHFDAHQYAASADDPPDVCDTPGSYIYDLHNVLHAAELQAAWAIEHDLQLLSGEHGYATGEHQLESPWAQCFRVLETLPWDDRKLRKWLRQVGAGIVEVKCRLHRLDAAAAQRRYSKADGRPISLLVTRLGPRVRAIAAERVLGALRR